MAKSFDGSINEQLRALARRILIERFNGVQADLADRLGVSAGFMSELLSGKRGAGLETLIGLGRFAPLELLSIVGIDPAIVVTLVEGRNDELEAGLANLPEVLRRAARAAIELEGCTPAAACEAALWAFDEYGAVPGTDADWWLGKIRKRLDSSAKSGERPSEKLRLLENSRG